MLDMSSKRWNIDVAVLCIFFARPKQFEKMFAQVKKARPRVLLLWQDGPRKEHPDDMDNILACRKIAEDIDWECEVHTNYHKKNMGCDPSTHLSHKWAFGIVDKCIILEDDLVVSDSFFPFCKELLDKYENDQRVDRICGMNLLEIYDVPYDYFFARSGNSWGWATWKRVADTWESDYKYFEDEYAVRCLQYCTGNPQGQEKWLDVCKKRRDSGIPYWEEIVGARTLLNSGLVIFPSHNMVCNIGLDANSTHAPTEVRVLPLSVQRLFNMKTYECNFPLTDPKYMIADQVFPQKCSEILQSKGKRWEGIYRKIRYGGLTELRKSISRKLIKIVRRKK